MNVTLDELLQSAERVEKGIPLTTELDQALYHGSSIGGARPKALIEDNSTKYIAKFSSSTDLYSVIKAEFVSMRLGSIIGLNVAPVAPTKFPKRMYCLSSVSIATLQDKVGSVNVWFLRLPY